MSTSSVRRLAGIVTLLAVLVLGMTPAAARAEPQLTEANPTYGDVIQTLPEYLRLCFTEPVRVDDPENWRFSVVTPVGRALGLRIVFEPSGDCVDVYPGAPEEPPQGIWTFDWLVRGQADGSEGSGSIKFQLGALQPGETPLDKPDSLSDSAEDGDGSSTLLVVAMGLGVVLVMLATGGFVISRRRRR